MTDDKQIDEFLERARSFYKDSRIPFQIKKKLPTRKQFETFRVAYDGDWTYYSGNTVPVRCQLPEDTSTLTALPDCAKDCWKLLMFRRKPEEIKASVNLLMPLLRSGEISAFKHNADQIEQPADGYLIVIYTVGLAERDSIKAKLHSIGFKSIPYRRGCKSFEQQFGHWKQWFPEE